ncbi:protein polybromo-1 isoform X5 [Cimex lectularius]|uniref:Protein polybromo-1 n=1 Tax=Cimex lectularius TaxID=79782 RepID=A0A8I6RPS6_CIMLE|nr:protein polybromo-1 isoform X5 [Cimex lectularius]
MSKRRRTSSVASRGIDEEESDSHPAEVKKKRKQDPSEIVQQLYDLLRNHKKDDGTLLCDSFIRAPKRRQEPAYYEVVANPIDMLKVQQKLKTDEYDDIEEFTSDIELLVSNAKAFYKRTSHEYKDANELWELLQSAKSKLLDCPPVVMKQEKKENHEDEPPPVKKKVGRKPKAEKLLELASIESKKSDDTEDTSEGSAFEEDAILMMCEDLFTVVMTAMSEDERQLHIPFQLLPSRKRYPKYYEVIENPIDLRTIAKKIQQGKYTNLGDIEKDLVLMTKNACAFNEPGSQIYKDAKYLNKIIKAKKIEIEQGKYLPTGKGSERIRSKRLRSGQSLSAITAALKSEDEEEEEECDSMVEQEDSDDPCWQLFNTIKNYSTPQSGNLAEPFHKLPSKRYYPDYFKEIRNPISMTQISKKLQKGDYGTVSEVAGDLNIMFENAKKYNRADSKLYKDAVKLQKLMQKRVKELLDFDHQYSASEDDSEPEPQPKTPKSSIKLPPQTPLPGTIGGPPPGTPVTPQAPASTTRLLTRGKYLDNIPLKRRLYSLCKCVMNYVCQDGRQPMLMFMEKPSRKLYPDYYKVIDKPVDMLTIEANIKQEKYTSEEEILADFKLMFQNCRKYNEEGSMIYEDALKLEKILMNKVKELGPLPDPEKKPIEKKTPKSIGVNGPKPKKLLTPNHNSSPKSSSSSDSNHKPKLLNNNSGYKKNSPVFSSGIPGPKPKRVLMLGQNSPKVIDHALAHKLRTLYHTLRDYKDPKGRQLSQIFLKLPSKTEYPDYYEVIKKPINLEQISAKLKTNSYEGLDDLCSDFILMFDNACKYNEPDSQIYKDALALQRVAIQTKLQLRQDEQSVPDVPSAVQELLTSLFISVYNHQDEEGRCFSDSMQELPEHDEVDGKKIRALSLDLIKRRLDGGQYKRLDLFQEDIFSCLQRARNLSRSDSQVFEDSVELQSYFIRQRDELCRNGDLLHSPALNYTLLDLSNAVDSERQTKQALEQPEEEQDIKPIIKEEHGVSLAGTADNALSYNQQVYRIGDFVYAEGKERGMDPIILNIQRLWTNQEGQQMLYGNQYYRPNETYHVTTRKFLEKEVFKTEQNVAIPLNQVLGRCCVMSVKDYFRSKPEGVDEKDIYVCESRYSARARAFKKIKNWPPSLMTGYKLVPREEQIEPKRIMSVFRQRVEKHKEEIAELEEHEKVIVDKERPFLPFFQQNVPVNPPIENSEGFTYYEQINTPACVIKTGDCVYMKTDSGRQLIAQADFIWMNKDGEAFFRGPWVVMPSEIPHTPNRLFYKQEVFLSTLEDTHSVNNIISKCVVLEHAEYISCRPTEFNESDVYVCESMYDEARRSVKELPREGLKKYAHSSAVTQDEIYFFRRLINPSKVMLQVYSDHSLSHSQSLTPVSNNVYNNQYDNSVDSDVMMEDSMDSPPSGAGDSQTPTGVKKQLKASGKKLVTGYILYSGDVRKAITTSNPDCNVGEVSRIVGNEWRKLPASEKAAWEERAARINEETSVNNKPSEESHLPLPSSVTETVFECGWENCDWQFEDVQDAIEHAISDGVGHIYQHFQALNIPDIEYQCQWRGCTRTRKTIPPFPNLQRLARHVREVHLLKSTGRAVTLENRSKNYVPKAKPPPPTPPPTSLSDAVHAAIAGLSSNFTRNTPSPMSQNGSLGANGRIPEPLFVSVPPRPQRLLHSEAYIKYIEGLTVENRNICNWDKQLRATQASIEGVDLIKLPVHWLGNRAGNHGNVLNALWTLRDFMFKDALGISKHL